MLVYQKFSRIFNQLTFYSCCSNQQSSSDFSPNGVLVLLPRNKFIVLLFILFCVTSCRSTEPTINVNPLIIPGDDFKYLFVTHGIGRHCIGHSAVLTNEISRQLQLTRKRPLIDLIEECQTSEQTLAYPEGQDEICDEMPNCVALKHSVKFERRLKDGKIIDDESREETYGYLVIKDLMDEDGNLTLRVFELTWSKATEWPKRNFLGNFNRDSGFRVNDQIHNALINSALSDAVLYIGNYKEQIQIPFYDAICYMSLPQDQIYFEGKIIDKCNFKEVFQSQTEILKQIQLSGVTCNDDGIVSFEIPDLENTKNTISELPRIYGVTASLGSRIMFDIMNDLYSFDAQRNSINEVSKLHDINDYPLFGAHLALSGIIFQSRIKNFYLLANQIPLLELSNLSRPGQVLKKQGFKQLSEEEIKNIDNDYSLVLSKKVCTEETLEKQLEEKFKYEANFNENKEDLQKLKHEIVKKDKLIRSLKARERTLEENVTSIEKENSQLVFNTKFFIISNLQDAFKGLEEFFSDYRKKNPSTKSDKELMDFYFKTPSNEFSFSQSFIVGANYIFDSVKDYLVEKDIEYALYSIIFTNAESQNGTTLADIEKIFDEEIPIVISQIEQYIKENDIDYVVEADKFVSILEFEDSDYKADSEQIDKNLLAHKSLTQEISSIKNQINSLDDELIVLNRNKTTLSSEIDILDALLGSTSVQVEKSKQDLEAISDELRKFEDSFKFLGQLVAEIQNEIELISISDPADVLNYELNKLQGWASKYSFYQELKNLQIKIDTSIEIPFLYSDVIDSHSNYARDPKVAWYIACGVNSDIGADICLNKKPKDIEGVAQWGVE